MRKFIRLLLLIPAATLALLAGSSAVAGGLYDIEELFDADNFPDDPLINNEYWPLIPGTYFVYFAETEDGCEWNVVDVTDDEYEVEAGVNTVVVLDIEWLDESEDCSDSAGWDPSTYDPDNPFTSGPSGDDVMITEYTFDWHAQDESDGEGYQGGHVWYLGEWTLSFPYEADDCDGPMTWSVPLGDFGCPDGSFEAGLPLLEPAHAGIVMLADPQKGDFYRQELDEDNAEDWGKVLNFIPLDSDDFEQAAEEDCLKTKEWSPLEPGAVEHKFYCPGEDGLADGLLLLIEEVSGGPKIEVDLVFASDNYLP